jgi:hypothetical protein
MSQDRVVATIKARNLDQIVQRLNLDTQIHCVGEDKRTGAFLATVEVPREKVKALRDDIDVLSCNTGSGICPA